MRCRDDQGTTIPLILGFFIIALITVAGAVAAGDAFVQQRGLQDVCDGAAAAGAAGAANLDRGVVVAAGRSLRFADAQRVVDDYLARDPGRAAVRIDASLSADARTLQLTCTETNPIAFGAMFGKGDGIRHIARSSAKSPLS
ncbi:MAG: pilus assembly protein TadG-related protein [Pseudonocardiales bacterium]